MAKSEYRYGKDKEQRLAQLLRNKSASVGLSKASRGTADMVAMFSTGRKWLIEVKSSRRETPASLTHQEKNRLNRAADKINATPVLARVTPRSVEFRSTRSDRKLSLAPRSRKKR